MSTATLNDWITEALDGSTRLACTRFEEPIISSPLIAASFGTSLAPARLTSVRGQPCIEWRVASRGALGSGDARVAAFLDDLRRKVAEARAAMATLEKAERLVNRKCRLPIDDYNSVAARLGMKQADGVSHVLVESDRLDSACDMMKRAAETIEPLLTPGHVVDGCGELKLAGWGVYRARIPDDPTPPPAPTLSHHVQGAGKAAVIVLSWAADPSCVDGFQLETRVTGGEWAPAAEPMGREIHQYRIPFEGDRHVAQYRISTGGPRGRAISEPISIFEQRPADPIETPPETTVPLSQAPLARVVRVSTPGGPKLRVQWTFDTRHPPYAEKGWMAQIQRRFSDTAEWQAAANLPAGARHYDDPVADPRQPAAYQVCVVRNDERSTWGQAAWSGTRRRSRWPLLLSTLALLLLAAFGAYELLQRWPPYSIDAPDTQYVFGGESVPEWLDVAHVPATQPMLAAAPTPEPATTQPVLAAVPMTQPATEPATTQPVLAAAPMTQPATEPASPPVAIATTKPVFVAVTPLAPVTLPSEPATKPSVPAVAVTPPESDPFSAPPAAPSEQGPQSRPAAGGAVADSSVPIPPATDSTAPGSVASAASGPRGVAPIAPLDGTGNTGGIRAGTARRGNPDSTATSPQSVPPLVAPVTPASPITPSPPGLDPSHGPSMPPPAGAGSWSGQSPGLPGSSADTVPPLDAATHAPPAEPQPLNSATPPPGSAGPGASIPSQTPAPADPQLPGSTPAHIDTLPPQPPADVSPPPTSPGPGSAHPPVAAAQTPAGQDPFASGTSTPPPASAAPPPGAAPPQTPRQQNFPPLSAAQPPPEPPATPANKSQAPFQPGRDFDNRPAPSGLPGNDHHDSVGSPIPRQSISGLRVRYDRDSTTWLKTTPPDGLAMSLGVSLHVPGDKASQFLQRPIRDETIVRYGLDRLVLNNLPRSLKIGNESWVDLSVRPGQLPQPPTDSAVNLSWAGWDDLRFRRPTTQGLFEISPQEALVWVGIRPTNREAANPNWWKNYQFRFLAPDGAASASAAPSVQGWFTDSAGPMYRLVMRAQDEPVTGYVEVLDRRTNQVVGQTIPLTLEAMK